MGAFKDLRGQRFSKLVVLERAENARNGQARFKCRCDCGNEVVVVGSDLKSGRTQSCGCFQRECAVQKHTTHGMRHTKNYSTWCNIRQRCYNPKSKYYKDYGGRGITMYEPWINDFQAFYDYVSQLEHFGEDGFTFDRVEVNGNYEPGNLRWATMKEQQRNRRNNACGERMTLAEAAGKSGIGYFTLIRRYNHGDYERGRLFRPVGSK